ncbi:MAG: hypothetical protein ACR2N9_05760 [Acidimicrobiia bacterium]
MRRPTTALAIIAIVVVAVALALRSNRSDEAAPVEPSAPTTTAPTSTDPDSSSTTETATSISTSTTVTAPPGIAACDLYSDIVVSGTVPSPDLVEASGLAASRTTPDVLWSHNDSRGGPLLYAFSPSGIDLGAHEIPDAFALDWEDMAAGPASDGTGAYLYVGDLGDNFGIRDGVVAVWRVPDIDPTQLDGEFPESLPIALSMPDGPYDAEALFIDPVEPALYIVTKSRSEAFVFKGPMTPASSPQEMELVATLFLDAEVSGADISADGGIIALRGYNSVWMWNRTPGQSVAEALTADPCNAPSPDERQGESITFNLELDYFTVSEGTAVDINTIPADR